MNDRAVIDEIRNRLDIVDIIGESVALKKAGSTFKGLCPFHSEKSPSFVVSSERGYYKCFGCGKSGDIFTFLMETAGVTFADALRELARRAGVTLKALKKGETDLRDALHEMNSTALDYFTKNLASKAGEPARKYLADRGIGAGEIDKFRIGLALEKWDGFLKLVEKNYTTAILKVSGLVRERDSGRSSAPDTSSNRSAGGFYDLFRDRIIFPIFDVSGRAIAFGAREYRTDDRPDGGSVAGARDGARATKGPKYINSPETEIYTKGRNLYGLHLAKDAIKRSGRAVFVEGYTDVIAAHREGFSEVVASLGTALTNEQVATISRFTSTVILAYDPDSAGRNAAERGIDIALNKGLSVRVAQMPEGLDPADALQKHGANAFGLALRDAQDFIEHRIRCAMAESHTVIERARAARGLVSSLNRISDRIIRATIIKTISERLGVPEMALTATADESLPEASEESTKLRKIAKGMDAELSLMRMMLDDPALLARAAVTLEPVDFSKPVRRDVFSALVEAARNNEPLKGDLGGRIQGLGLELMAHIATAPLSHGPSRQLFDDYMKTVQMRRINDDISECAAHLQLPDLPEEKRNMMTQRLSTLLKKKGETLHPPVRSSSPHEKASAARQTRDNA
ncbi:MAG: DNA primase [Candidatus Hydrogenedentota bacterium]